MHKACPISELAPGQALRLDTAPSIAGFHTEAGDIFAVDTCTHRDASRADGYLEDCGVEYPLHASSVSRRTEALNAPPAKLPVGTHESADRRRQHHDHRIGRGPQPSARSDSRGPCLTAGPCLTEQRTRSWLLIVT